MDLTEKWKRHLRQSSRVPKDTNTSPTPSSRREGSRSRSVSPPKRSKARLAANPSSSTSARGAAPPSAADDDTIELIKQPETRPILQEQLVAEVKGIYAGLVIVESKCIEVDNNQSSQNDPANRLNNDQWQALIALHRTLLHEHHDFFLASQHPSASPALRRLAAKYAMPARFRQGPNHGASLSPLGHPRSPERIVAALLLFEVAARLPPTELNFVKTHGILFSGKQQDKLDASMEAVFQSLDNHIGRSARRWIESGYHMAISNICAITGYSDNNNPITAALKAFSSLRPSDAANDTRAQPMEEAPAAQSVSSENDTKDTTVSTSTQLSNALRLFTGTYDIICRRFGDNNILPFLHVTLVFVYYLTFCPDAMAHVAPHFPWKLTASMLNTLLNGSSPSSSSPSTAAAAPVSNVSQAAGLAQLVESKQFPGSKKGVSATAEGGEKGDSTALAGPSVGAGRRKRPLPDDYAIRGFPWVEKYFPDGWFVTEDRIDDDDKYFEVPSMLEERKERVVWLGCRIAESEDGKWLRFDNEAKRFGVSPEYDVELELEMGGQVTAAPGESVDYGELPDAGVTA
ncbi:hypothetical protein MYCTH_89981 [Thermothelomyces thermophilus ATCC 42464]|uniref:DNA/RNA-binding domain-containing protein n=1 Tax=Thermothelomyces thermophilus (strain ATCC 42464 / BCRC 31852 / DSM 1799) TaxID=573729 RepID=G2QM19_THET4|nr:uncharacterized protein MYCTH_89981 [Thermothelomyces thermophilus ATCC 42464]AEO60999.1 hypothetical protein MYCTH_89981 [Thermothelomyces thermophilus ATCC 42464]